jgi:hypothetical protein
MMTNNVLSLSIVTRGTHIDDLEETLIFEVGDIDTPNLMMSLCYVHDTMVIVWMNK